jgi:tRNA-splicing ligase RtcB
MGVRTALKLRDVRDDLPRLADRIARDVSFGIGRKSKQPVEHALFESETWREVPELTTKVQRRHGAESLRDRAEAQLGTVGGGNHYVDLLVEPETDDLWVAAHFGSRGFGHGVATGFLNVAAGRAFHSTERLGESMHAAPSLLRLGAPSGDAYRAAMELAGEYAYAGREHVVGQVLRILGTDAEETVHNHHNFAWEEEHDGERVMVVRKGATPAAPGQTGFVGGSMGDLAVVVRGVDTEPAQRSLRSTVHGAGRVMSRSQARGNRKGTRRGLISRKMMHERLDEFRREHGYPLELRGGDVDESPFVYRPLRDVIAAHEGTIEVVHELLPVVVCMAPPETRDPFKD